MRHFDVLIVGAGHGGAQAASALRQGKFAGSIGIVGQEHDLPYERPPLSKEYLAGEKPFERILIRQPGFWKEREVDIVTGTTIVAIDAAEHRVIADDGTAYGYNSLIWAAGGAARTLSCAGSDLAGVHTVRTRADADRLMAEMPDVRRAVVVGGGYIGLEAAAVLAKFGKQVVLLEALDRVLARVAGAELSSFYQDEHRAHGVDIRLNAGVERLSGDGRVSAVHLADGSVVDADLVIVGIGIVPAVAPLMEAGAVGGNGVLVDERCRTSLPDVFAIGDCALHANRYAGGIEIRVESVQNANDQANVVAKTILGDEASYTATPWFWSNQYDLKLQTVGISAGHDATVLRGDPASRSFSVVYLRSEKVIALDCVNATRDYVQGKALVEKGAVVAPRILGDADVPLKSMVQPAS